MQLNKRKEERKEGEKKMEQNPRNEEIKSQ
jgi:hypothetical protein